MKPQLVTTFLLFVLSGGVVHAAGESITRQQLNFLERQQQPLFATDVENRLGAVDGRKGCFCYPYKVRGEKTTVDFWMAVPPPTPPPPQGRPVEIAMVVEQRDGAQPKIIWPRNLSGTSVEAARKKLYPHGW